MGAYRCLGCREYKRGAPWRKMGLGGVCSEECLRTYRQPKKAKSRPPDVPDDVRAAVRERDRGRCRLCGSTANLEAHHIAYRSEGGAHTEQNLITLCRDHHAFVHTDKRRWQPVLFAYIRSYYGQGVRPSLAKLDREMNPQLTAGGDAGGATAPATPSPQ